MTQVLFLSNYQDSYLKWSCLISVVLDYTLCDGKQVRVGEGLENVFNLKILNKIQTKIL